MVTVAPGARAAAPPFARRWNPKPRVPLLDDRTLNLGPQRTWVPRGRPLIEYARGSPAVGGGDGGPQHEGGGPPLPEGQDERAGGAQRQPPAGGGDDRSWQAAPPTEAVAGEHLYTKARRQGINWKIV
eukprot:1193984-Prorocentrum_minimum.AAC.1